MSKLPNPIFFFVIIAYFTLNLNILLKAQSFSPDTIQYRYWVYFRDKGEFKPNDKFELGDKAYKTAKAQLTEKACLRRSKVLPEKDIVSYKDIPLNVEYIGEITKLGVKIYAISKWLNAVSIQVTRPILENIKKLGFVKKLEGVHFLEDAEITLNLTSNSDIYKSLRDINLKFNYGPSYWQNEQINVPILHYCGITGWGITIGMCDAGFNWRNHQALKDRKVLGEYDWIFQDDSTLNQFPPNQYPEDKCDQDSHGTSTFSTIGGFYEGQMIGPAFDADFYLSKTEDVRTETPVEEDYWLEGAEWMESKGIDVLSSSLIYKPFDKPNNSYDYNDMDGKTTVVVQAAENLVHQGVVVCNSMGNERQTNPPSIVSPPDGDSVISVGAVDSAGVIARFSSNGPSSDGRIKPDVVALGVHDWTAVSSSITLSDSDYSYSSGTSFSCPLTAGVCALILSTHPELTPMQVKEALKMTANNKENPNNVYGWGLINAYDAVLYYGMIMSNKPEVSINNDSVTISTYVLSRNTINQDAVNIYYSNTFDNEFKSVPLILKEKLDEFNSGRYSTTLNLNFDPGLSELKIYFTAKDSRQTISSPFNAPEKFFIFNKENLQIQLY
jgi:serine protease AprX